MIVFDGTLSDDVLQREQKQIEEFISKDAKMERVDVWGKRSLTYTIKKKKTGYYCLFLYEGEGDIATAIDKHVKLNESVLRYMTVVRNVKNDIARAAVAVRKERPVPESDRDDDIDDMDL
jgi:small subunit ribosomal protein S6